MFKRSDTKPIADTGPVRPDGIGCIVAETVGKESRKITPASVNTNTIIDDALLLASDFDNSAYPVIVSMANEVIGFSNLDHKMPLSSTQCINIRT